MTEDCRACVEGFIGFPYCRDNPCDPDPCNGHGSCDTGEGACSCDNPYMTALCGACTEGYIEYPNCRDNPCDPNPCSGHGTCHPADGSCTCDNPNMTANCGTCIAGNIGYPNCRDDLCAPDPCNSNGSCSPADGSCTCDNPNMTADCGECSTGYDTFPACNHCMVGYIDFPNCRKNPCLPDPCNGHGTCNPTDGNCTCNNQNMTADCGTCAVGYIGYPICVDDPCLPDPCNGHGTCNPINLECSCNFTNMTADCSDCLVSYGNYPLCNSCAPEAFGEFPNCFLPSNEFCITSQCFIVPPTGQTSCYNNTTSIACPGTAGSSARGGTAFCGQDAQYTRNVRTYTCFNANGTVQTPCDGTANTNEVVTDSLTGLIWQRTWNSTGKTWQEALDYCTALSYGGYEDWRLPNRFELQSLV